jgi:CheY-like chemotaxis protein
MTPAGSDWIRRSRNSRVPVRDANSDTSQTTPAVNTFRLISKYQFPMVVSSFRPCRASAGNLVRGVTGVPGLRHRISESQGGGLRRGGLAPGEQMETPAGFTLHSLVLADDHPVVRQSLKKLLNQQPDFNLVGESDNGLETLNLVKQLQPDLLVTDLMMPGMNGLEVTRRIRLSFPATRVVVVSVNADEPYVAGAFRCGANGFVLKTACGRHLVPAIRAVLAGQRYVSPPLSEPIL